jgi:hypothetical protein
MVQINLSGQSPNNSSGQPSQRGSFDAAKNANQRFQDYDKALGQRARQGKADNKGFADLAANEARLRKDLNAVLAKEVSFRESQLKSEQRLVQQARQLQHRSSNSVLTPSSYQVMQRATGQLAFNASQFKQQHGYNALPANTINALRTSLGTEGGAFRTAAISRLGSLGQRSAFAGEFTQTVKMQKELEKISRTTTRQLQFETDPVKIASLQRQVSAMNVAKGRIGEGLESMSPMRRKVGMGFGMLGYAMSNPAVSTGIAATLATVAAPYSMQKLYSGVLGMASPYNDFRIGTAALGRAGGFNSQELTDAILPRGVLDYKGLIPGLGRDRWMQQLGMGPSDVTRNLGNYGVAERSVPDSLVAATSIRSEYLSNGIGLPEDSLAKMLGYGRASGAVQGGKGFQDSASRYWTQLEKVMSTATAAGLDQSRAGSTLMSLQQNAASSGALSTNTSGFADLFSRMAQSGAPGMRDGSGILSLVLPPIWTQQWVRLARQRESHRI